VLLGGLPGVVVSLVWLWTGDHGIEVRWTLTVVVVVTWVAAAIVARERVIRPLQTLSNLLSGLREGDYSVRGAGANDNDALGIAMTEINALGNTLQAQRLGAMEATALLRTVIDVRSVMPRIERDVAHGSGEDVGVVHRIVEPVHTARRIDLEELIFAEGLDTVLPVRTTLT